MGLTFIDMFAGIGGFHSGMEQAGHKCVGWIEWDKYARQSYQAMYNTEGLFSGKDIQNVRGADLPDADVWCFGSPCQDISVAGKQAGLEKGSKSSMFFEVIRLLKERTENAQTLPTYLLMENVKNLLSSNGGWDFARVQIEMDKAGYDVEWNVFDSAEVVPQHRERVYIVGHFRGQRTRKVFPIIKANGTANSKAIVKQVAQLHSGWSFNGNPQRGRVYATDGAAPTLATMQGGGLEPKVLVSKPEFGRLGEQAVDTFNEHSIDIKPGDAIEPYNHRVHTNGKTPTVTTRPEGLKTAILAVDQRLRIRKLTPKECWRLQGFKDEQFDKAKNAGVSNSQLYKQAGNAVTVPVVKAVAERLA